MLRLQLYKNCKFSIIYFFIFITFRQICAISTELFFFFCSVLFSVSVVVFFQNFFFPLISHRKLNLAFIKNILRCKLEKICSIEKIFTIKIFLLGANTLLHDTKQKIKIFMKIGNICPIHCIFYMYVIKDEKKNKE